MFICVKRMFLAISRKFSWYSGQSCNWFEWIWLLIWCWWGSRMKIQRTSCPSWWAGSSPILLFHFIFFYSRFFFLPHFLSYSLLFFTFIPMVFFLCCFISFVILLFFFRVFSFLCLVFWFETRFSCVYLYPRLFCSIRSSCGAPPIQQSHARIYTVSILSGHEDEETLLHVCIHCM